MWAVERIEMRCGRDRGRWAHDSGRVEKKMDKQGKKQEGVDLLARSAFSATESRRTPCTDLTLGRLARRQATNLPRRVVQCCLVTSV